MPRYERLAEKLRRQANNGASVNTLASAHGITWNVANQILTFALTGQRSDFTERRRPGPGNGKPQKYKAISEQVVQMRNQQMPFTRIAEALGVGGPPSGRVGLHTSIADTEFSFFRGPGDDDATSVPMTDRWQQFAGSHTRWCRRTCSATPCTGCGSGWSWTNSGSWPTS